MGTHRHPSSARASGSAFVTIAATALIGVLVLAPAGPAASTESSGTAGASTEQDATVTATATLMNVVTEPAPEHAGEPGHDGTGEADHARIDEGLEIRTFLDLGEAIVAVPDEVGTTPGSTGDQVTVTLATEPGMTAEQAVEDLAEDGGDSGTRIVDVEPAAAAPEAAAAAPIAAALVTGPRPLTILPVYWSTRDSATRASLKSLADTTAAYWSQQTGNRVTFSTAAREWALITDPNSCDLGTMWTAALTAHGYTPAPDEHVVVYFPRRADCENGWAGAAAIGDGSPGGPVWINGSQLPDVLAHEIGHNLGLGHANRATCTADGGRIPLVLPISGCTRSEYGDYADVMGIGMAMTTGNLTTAFADHLGVATVSRPAAGTSTTVDLSPLASTSSLRSIALPVSGGVVYVDFRPAAGRDVRVTEWAGVQVHLRTMDPVHGYPTTYLLDMSPETSSAFASPQLAAGRSWAVPGTSDVVTVVSTGSTARVTVAPAPVPTSGFAALRPTRVHDRRAGVSSGVTQCFAVTGGTTGVPSGARGVVLNVATVGPRGPGHLVAYPDPGTTSTSAAPSTATVNFTPGQDVANAAVVALPSNGRICYLLRGASAGVVVDVTGYLLTGTGVELRRPVRLHDRSDVATASPVTVQVAGVAGVPADATAVLVNVAGAGSGAPGNVRLYPAGAARPTTSTLNLSSSGDKSNAAIVQLSSGGALTYVTETSSTNRVRVVLDVVGWTTAGSDFVPVTPVRALDTRSSGRLVAGNRLVIPVPASVPDGAAVVLNAAVVAPNTYGNLRVFPYDATTTAVPNASSLNYIVGTDVANMVITGMGADRKVVVYTDQYPGGTTDVVLDVVGYLTASE